MNGVLIIFRQGAPDQVMVDGRDIGHLVTRIEIVKAGKTAPEIRLTLNPVMVTTVSPDAQLRIDGLEDCPEHLAREAYRLLHARFGADTAAAETARELQRAAL